MEDYGLDMDEVVRVIESADVLVVRFAIVDTRLLIDARTTDTEGPLIAVVPKAGSVEERFKALKKLRPRFSLPDKIMSFTLSLIHISEPTRLGMISYAVF